METPEKIKESLKLCMLEGSPCKGCDYNDYGCFAALVSDAIAYINQLENHTGKATKMVTPTVHAPTWISVNERLPENETPVLTYAETRKDSRTIHGHVIKAFYTDGKAYTEDSVFDWDTDYLYDSVRYDPDSDKHFVPEGWWESARYSDEFYAVYDLVTHWMPLPEPPKENGGK